MYESQRKQVTVSFEGLSEKASGILRKHLEQKGIQYRMNRSIQVEGAFGVLKNDYKFQRFLLRRETMVMVKLEIIFAVPVI